MFTGIQWLGHATIRIEASGKSVIVDPYQIKNSRPHDVILITHAHYDHLSPDDIKKVKGKESVTVSPPDCVEQLGPDTKVLTAGDHLQLNNGILIEAYPSYNIDKAFHPKEKGWLGYIVEIDNKRFYIAGDTDRIPEMKGIRCDIAFLPVGGNYTMNAAAAAAAAQDIDTKWVVPIHWGTIVGARSDAEDFVTMVGDKAKILIPEK